VQAARELGVRIVASRGSMDLGVSDGGLPPDELVEELDASSPTPSASPEPCTSPARGPRTDRRRALLAVLRHRRLMEESAALARRLGLVLHTHLAETVEEEAYCRELYGCSPVEYLDRLGWLDRDVWCAHCVHLSDDEVARFRSTGTGVAHCPTSNLRLAPASLACARCATRACASASAWTARVERAERPLHGGQAGTSRRPGAGWRRRDDSA
jgi:cytosine/adenosine deaminase-related metal-dependent hydrolase